MLSISMRNYTNLPLIHKKIEEAAKKGVEAAVHETVEWIKDDVIKDGNYVGHQYYPDVTAATKRSKAKKGQTIVLKDTGNYLSSWDGKAKGLKGVITGGGGASAEYSAKLYARGWKIDKLWAQVHAKESEKIIKAAIEKVI